MRVHAAMLGALLLSTGCVPAGAGYDDVKSLTSARLGEQVRWDERDGPPSDKQTERLLHEALTADGAVRVALLNNQGLQADFEKLGIGRGQLQGALGLPNPRLGAALRYRGSERPEIDLDATLSLSQLLFIPWRTGAANAEFDASKVEVARGAIQLAFATRAAFFDCQAAAQQLELRRTVLQSLQASAEMAQNLREAGNITALLTCC